MLEARGAKEEIGDEPKYLYPPADKIIMPKKSLFVDLRNWYATRSHVSKPIQASDLFRVIEELQPLIAAGPRARAGGKGD